MQSQNCARCGKRLIIEEFIKYNRQLKILGRYYMIHLCKLCFDLIEEKRE